MPYIGSVPAQTALTSANIADAAVNSDQIATGAVDLAHMSTQSVDEDNLHISNAGSNGQFLSKQSGDAGGLTWAATGGTEITDQFKVRGSGQTDITGDGTDYTLIFTNSEIYDAGGVFTTSTYTASVAGKVHLATVVEAGPFASGHTRLLMRIVTSNRTYTLWDCNPYSVTNDGGSGSSSYNRWQGSIIADMDASDTAHVTLYVAGGAKVIDTGATDDCQFSGYLIKD